jgi:hypothetical protein
MLCLKKAVLWEVTLCESCKNEVSEESTASIIGLKRISELFTLMMAIFSFENSVPTKTTRCHIPEDCIPRSYRREILKSDIALTG